MISMFLPGRYSHHVRLRISSCGIVDVLMYDTRQDIALVQQEDLVMFGRLVFALCCGSLAAMNTLPKALDMMGRMYSADVKTLTLYLISKPGSHKVNGPFSKTNLTLIAGTSVDIEYCTGH